MVSADEVRLVANYIEEKPERLTVAYAARQAWLQVREWIAIRFLDGLERTLYAGLCGGWETTNPRGRVFSQHYEFGGARWPTYFAAFWQVEFAGGGLRPPR